MKYNLLYLIKDNWNILLFKISKLNNMTYYQNILMYTLVRFFMEFVWTTLFGDKNLCYSNISLHF